MSSSVDNNSESQNTEAIKKYSKESDGIGVNLNSSRMPDLIKDTIKEAIQEAVDDGILNNNKMYFYSFAYNKIFPPLFGDEPNKDHYSVDFLIETSRPKILSSIGVDPDSSDEDLKNIKLQIGVSFTKDGMGEEISAFDFYQNQVRDYETAFNQMKAFYNEEYNNDLKKYREGYVGQTEVLTIKFITLEKGVESVLGLIDKLTSQGIGIMGKYLNVNKMDIIPPTISNAEEVIPTNSIYVSFKDKVFIINKDSIDYLNNEYPEFSAGVERGDILIEDTLPEGSGPIYGEIDLYDQLTVGELRDRVDDFIGGRTYVSSNPLPSEDIFNVFSSL